MRRARPWLGTIVEIRLGEGASEAALEAAFGAVARVQRLMSAQNPASDVSRIGRAAAGVRIPVDPWTWAVLLRAREISELTHGLFDCCVAQRGARYHDLELLSGSTVRVRRPLRVTLDGIAKGFAVDRAVGALRAAGVVSGAVNAGGDLRLFGRSPEPVCVRHPADPGRLLRVGSHKEVAVATSAFYYSEAVPTIVHPATRRACPRDASATVIAPDCMTADALTKPLLIDPRATAAALPRLNARAFLQRAERVAA